MEVSTDLIETLLLSHLYTLMQHHDIRTGVELKHLGIDKLVNPHALEDIMNHQAMFARIDLQSFKHTEEMRKELLRIIKTKRDELIG